jgi:hypothetical protein
VSIVRRVRWFHGSLLLLAAACKNSSPTSNPDAAVMPDPAVASSASASPSAVASAAAIDAGKALSLPPSSDVLELVAVGKGWSSKIVWLVSIGSRVWLSGMGFDAYADGDGPFIPAPDMLKGLPYESSKHRIEVVGAHPALFALRTKRVNGRIESPEATVFVRNGDAWKQAKPLPHDWFPHAFVGWNGGALLMYSQIELNSGAAYSTNEPGTSFSFVSSDGTVSDPKIAIERTFMAWTADSDGTTLSLLGARGTMPPKGETMGGANAIAIARGTGKEAMNVTTLGPASAIWLETYSANVRESGATAIVRPPPSPFAAEEGAWPKTPALSLLAVADAKPKTLKIGNGGDEQCGANDAVALGSAVYAIVHCMPDTAFLVRAAEGAKAQRVKMPLLAKKEGGGFRVAHEKENAFACEPKQLVTRGADDLFVEAQCGAGGGSEGPGIPAVFRLGRAQEPVILP